ncbi:MAG: hypothetical protein WBA97_28040 [Actinophytocola sp.]|uniref:hypothetical protein n=1 Tax=Actinophytocola sp. TaxID=1872138 RepID=UPI003C769ACA
MVVLEPPAPQRDGRLPTLDDLAADLETRHPRHGIGPASCWVIRWGAVIAHRLALRAGWPADLALALSTRHGGG